MKGGMTFAKLFLRMHNAWLCEAEGSRQREREEEGACYLSPHPLRHPVIACIPFTFRHVSHPHIMNIIHPSNIHPTQENLVCENTGPFFVHSHIDIVTAMGAWCAIFAGAKYIHPHEIKSPDA